MIHLSMQPQEIEVWYVLPALRRELAKRLLAKGLPQKKIAATLGVTEAAVSQYLHSKRAQGVRFSKEFDHKIITASERIAEGKDSSYEALQGLCRDFRECKELCHLHHTLEKIPQECDVCLEGK